MDSHDFDVRASRTITILRPPEDVYAAWRSLEPVARATRGALKVHVDDARRSQWSARIPRFGCMRWDSEIVREEAGREIEWRTDDGADVPHHGVVRFRPAPAAGGTEVTLEVEADLKGGKAGHVVSRLMGRSPEDYLSRALHGFKALMETGEVATNAGPTGRSRRRAAGTTEKES